MPHDPEKYAAAIRAKLGKLARLRARSEQAEGNIQAATDKRLEAVDADLAKLRPRVLLDDEAAQRYEDLSLERGRLVRM